MTKLTCPYCGGAAVLQDSAVLYHGHSYGNAWVCENYPECDAYVGCHRGTDEPLGRLANWELREFKKAAHACFDHLWQDGPMNRTQAYAWLAAKLAIPEDDCHIGMFDVDTCRRVSVLCLEYRTKRVTVGGHTEQQCDLLVEMIRKS